jgi:excisionase family DNA binding protein
MTTDTPDRVGGDGRETRVEVNMDRREAVNDFCPLLGMDDVALWLGTSIRHVQRLVTERRLPYVKVGHFIRFDPEDVTQWIEAQKIVGRSDRVPVSTTIDSRRQVAPPAPLTRRPSSAAEVLARWQSGSR